MFRASPWINYEPGADSSRHLALPPDHHPAHYNNRARQHYNIMNDDVDMDAPQISTLREEDTPPPQLPIPSRSKFRVNLLVGEKKGTNPPSLSGSRKTGMESDQEDDDEEHDELEEDQLIDDVDDGVRPLSVTLPAPTSKAKPNPKKRSRKGDKLEAKSGSLIQTFLRLLRSNVNQQNQSSAMAGTLCIMPLSPIV